jgi:hypothetical protein
MPSPLSVADPVAYAAPLARPRSRVAGARATVRWHAEFASNHLRPRPLATLPAGLALLRESTAEFPTNADETDEAAAHEGCLSQRTDVRATMGLLVRQADGPRAADSLYVPQGLVLDAGRLALEVTLVAALAADDLPGDVRVWTAGDGYAEIDAATRCLRVHNEGVTWESTVPMAWEAHDVVTLYVAAGGYEYAHAAYGVNGAAMVDLGAATELHPTLKGFDDDALWLCCDYDAQCWAGWVRQLRAFDEPQSAEAPEAPPAWSPADLGAKLYDFWSADDLTLAVSWDGRVNALTIEDQLGTGTLTIAPDGWSAGVPALRFQGATLTRFDAALVRPFGLWLALRHEDLVAGVCVADGGGGADEFTLSVDPGVGTYCGGASTTGPLYASVIGDGVNAVVGLTSDAGGDSALYEGATLRDAGTGILDPSGVTIGGSLVGSKLPNSYVRALVVTQDVLTGDEIAALAAYLLAH